MLQPQPLAAMYSGRGSTASHNHIVPPPPQLRLPRRRLPAHPVGGITARS
jgi:hypothetical protein